MKRWLGSAVVCAITACGSDPPPPAVTVPPASPSASASATPPAPSAAPAPSASASATESRADLAEPGLGSIDGSPPAASSARHLGSGPAHAPSLRQGPVTVTGRLPPEVVQRIVRQNFGRFRLCYETALRSDASMGGRVTVKFAIDRRGMVVGPADGGSDVPDKTMVACVVKAFANLAFPQPEGTVEVSYPIIFSP